MPRTLALAVAAGFAIFVIVGAAFVAEIRTAMAATFPGHARTIIGGTVVVMIGRAIVLAVNRIRAPTAGGLASMRGCRAWGLPWRRRSRSIRPGRADEVRDVVLDGVAIACGLLFSIGLSPPAHFTLPPRRGFARSRFSLVRVESAAKERTHRWRDQPPPAVGRLSREDHYSQRRALARGAPQPGDGSRGRLYRCRENRMLETFYAPLLDTGAYGGPTGFTWPAVQRAEAPRTAGGNDRPYVSDAPVPLYDWPKWTFWMMIALATSAVPVICQSRQKEQPWPST